MEKKIKLLLVDDEQMIRENLAALLSRSGFDVTTAADGEEALERVEQITPDLIVMDVLMPRLDGRSAVRTLREQSNWTPVILLTQIGDSYERASALEEGADDYLNKPFDTHELIARIKTVLRRARAEQPPLTAAQKLGSGALVFDRVSRRVLLNDKEVNLTPKAVTLLEYLLTHPDELITRERLLDAVWGWDYPVGTRAVDTRVAELRKLLHDDVDEPRYIETVPGQGYRFVGDVKPVT
ncbi:MAG: response regulator transcription factor [Anaerolineae bacterium]|nr:response regulator transcription factor [Anaerolineae bacterium]